MRKCLLMMSVLLALGMVAACGGGEEATAPAPADTGETAARMAGSGGIAGSVAYANGDPDTVIGMDADPVCAAMHNGDVHTETVVADAGNLANVFVYVKEGLSGSYSAPAEKAVLDQKGCQYRPHVSGIMVGQTLLIRNSDPTLHNVHGTLRLVRGEIRFDPAGGLASGEVVLDAHSATTGVFARDSTMQRAVLESERFPEIVFRPERLALEERTATSSTLALHGVLTIHGQSHPLVLRASSTADGDRLRATTQFTIPYVAWGMRGVSSLLLRVDKEVEVTVAAEGTLGAAGRPSDAGGRRRGAEIP